MFHYPNQISKYTKRYTRYHNYDLDVPQKTAATSIYYISMPRSQIENPSSENVDPCVFLQLYKFENDPMINESGIAIHPRLPRDVRIWNQEYTFLIFAILLKQSSKCRKPSTGIHATYNRLNPSASLNK